MTTPNLEQGTAAPDATQPAALPTPTPPEAPTPQPEEARTQAITVTEVLAEETAKEEAAKALPETTTETADVPTEDKPEDQPKSPQQIRRARARDKRDADRVTLKAQSDRIGELEREVQGFKGRTVDASDADDYEAAIQGNAVNEALAASKQAELDTVKTQRDKDETDYAAQSKADFTSRGNELEGVKDFDAVVFNHNVAFTQDTAAALLDMDNGPELAYELATKPDELARLNALQPQQRLIELGRISANLNTPKPQITTKAPEPIKPTEGASGAINQKPESELSYEEMRANLDMKVDEPGYTT